MAGSSPEMFTMVSAGIIARFRLAENEYFSAIGGGQYFQDI